MNYKEVEITADKIKKYPITIPRKIGHKAKVYELQDFITELEISTNGIIYESYEFTQYKSLVNSQYDVATKKELDARLKYVLITFLSTLERYVYNTNL